MNENKPETVGWRLGVRCATLAFFFYTEWATVEWFTLKTE